MAYQCPLAYSHGSTVAARSEITLTQTPNHWLPASDIYFPLQILPYLNFFVCHWVWEKIDNTCFMLKSVKNLASDNRFLSQMNDDLSCDE